MKFNTALLTAVVMATSALVSAIPIEKRDLAPYEVTYPIANSTVQVNQNAVISWNKGPDNSPINVGLVAGSDASLSSSSIVIAENISGALGTVVFPVPPSLGNGTSAWRVAISHGSDPIRYSSPFFISTSANGNAQQQVQQPSYTASASNATYSAVASISILGPNGQPVQVGGSTSDASPVSTFVLTYTLVPLIASYILY